MLNTANHIVTWLFPKRYYKKKEKHLFSGHDHLVLWEERSEEDQCGLTSTACAADQVKDLGYV